MYGLKILNYFRKCLSRNCSTLKRLEQDDKIMDQLTKSSEDLASFIRFNRQIQSIDLEKFKSLYNDSKENELKIKLILSEYEYLCQLNYRIPSDISLDHMTQLMRMKSFEQRQIFLIKAYLHETIKIRTKAKKIIKRKLIQQQRKNSSDETSSKTWGIFDNANENEIRYGLWRNCLFKRFSSKHDRLILQSGFNAQLWNPIVAFDWYLPENFLEIKEGRKLNEMNRKLFKKLAEQIFLISNDNLKSLNKSFNIIHLNLNEDSPIYPFIKELSEQSKSVNTFFTRYDHHTYLKYFNHQIVYYITPNASKILTEEDLIMEGNNKLIFIFNPYTELIGLSFKYINDLFEYKQNESKNNDKIQFRRLPLHDMIIDSKQKHLNLSFHIECLRYVIFDQIDWIDTLYKCVPSKYYKNSSINLKT